MKKLYLPLITASLLILSGQALSQAKVEINWQNPEKFNDIRPTSETRSKYREFVFKELQEYLQKLAEKLPDDQTLSMTVTNLDLAGQVWPASFVGLGMSGNDIRVVKSIDIPRMKFSYTLEDATKQVLQQGDVDLKDMAFMDRANRMFDSEAFRYEKNMLKNWFDDEFPALVAKVE